MATVILIAGAWHGGWCWERIIPLLKAAGHTVLAPDLIGMGNDQGNILNASLGVWADQVADLARVQQEPVILVGHSRGGIVISAAAELAPTAIQRLVYVSAWLIPSGQSLTSVAGAPPPGMFVQAAEGTIEISPNFIGPCFYNSTDPYWRSRAVSLMGPEPLAVASEHLSLTENRYGAIPRVYIECLKDQVIPIALQREMQAVEPCGTVFTLDNDHSPFYSNPSELSDCLISISRTAGL